MKFVPHGLFSAVQAHQLHWIKMQKEVGMRVNLKRVDSSHPIVQIKKLSGEWEMLSVIVTSNKLGDDERSEFIGSLCCSSGVYATTLRD